MRQKYKYKYVYNNVLLFLGCMDFSKRLSILVIWLCLAWLLEFFVVCLFSVQYSNHLIKILCPFYVPVRHVVVTTISCCGNYKLKRRTF